MAQIPLALRSHNFARIGLLIFFSGDFPEPRGTEFVPNLPAAKYRVYIRG